EVARRRVQDDVDALTGQVCTRALGHPSILADLETNLDSVEVEVKVPDRDGLSYGPDGLCRPRFEPTGLVVNTVSGQVLLRHEAVDRPEGNDRHAVVESALE